MATAEFCSCRELEDQTLGDGGNFEHGLLRCLVEAAQPTVNDDDPNIDFEFLLPAGSLCRVVSMQSVDRGY